MFRGLILSSTDNMEICMADDADAHGPEAEVSVKKLSGACQIIDTRELDFIVISPETASERELDDAVSDFVYSMRQTNHDTVVLDLNEETRYIDKEEILFIEVIGRDCFIYMNGSRYKLSRNALCHVMEAIDDPYLVRCHKSYAVNVRHLQGISRIRRGLWTPIFNSGDTAEECLIGRSYYKDVIEKHEEWLKYLNKLK